MGRQISVALTQTDETAFLNFLRGEADIKLIESFAPSPRDLWVDSFAAELTGHWNYHVWNRRFSWTPTYGRSKENACYKGFTGRRYVSNLGTAPVIEFSRSNVIKGKYGRLYWAKFFSAPNGLDYDVEMFSRWYDSVVRWIKRNAAGKVKDARVTWFLPGAWRIHTETMIQEEEAA